MTHPLHAGAPRALPYLLLGFLCVAALALDGAHARGFLLLVGGGAEGADGDTASWSYAPYQWFVERASSAGPNGGNGRIAIVDTEPYPECGVADRGYCAYFESLGAVEAIALHVSRACQGAPGCIDADAPEAFSALRAFDGVWFRGGDQAAYVQAYGDSEVERALLGLHTEDGVLGGTSAGAMILSAVTSSGDATSYEATSDPYHPRIALDDTLLGGRDSVTPPVLVDTHFTTRARLGRLAVFLARWQADTETSLLGVGIDEHTALAIDGLSVATVYGEGAVSFLLPPAPTAQTLVAGQPPFASGLRLEQLTAGFVYDLIGRAIVAVPDDAVPAGDLPPAPSYRSTLVAGATAQAPRRGERWTFWRDPQDLYTGLLRGPRGQGLVQGAVLSTLLEDETALREVRMGGPQWLLAGPLQHGLAVYLDGFDGDAFNRVFARDDETLLMLSPPATPEQSVVLLDCFAMQWVARSTADPDGNGLPRQSVALAPCAVHLMNSQLGSPVYDVLAHAPR